METNVTSGNMFNSSTPGNDSHFLDSAHIFSSLVLSICFLVGVPGNIAVLVLKPNWEHLSSLSQSLMMNQAISDLLCLLTLPMWIYHILCRWIFGRLACKLLRYLVYCSIICSLLTMTALGIQRYLVVVHEYRSDQIRKSVLLILLWLAAAVVTIFAPVIFDTVPHQDLLRCQFNFINATQMIVVRLTETSLWFASFCAVAFAYYSIHKKINRSVYFNHPRTTWLITSITVSNFVLWSPYIILNVLRVAAVALNNDSFLKLAIDNEYITASLVFLNNCLNPLLYVFTSSKVYSICFRKDTNTRMSPASSKSTDAAP